MFRPPAKPSATSRPARSGSARLSLAIALLLWCGAEACPADETETADEALKLEYQLKAGFLFNFAKFVQWPATNMVTTNDFCVGIVDTGSAYEVLADALNGKRLNQRLVVTKKVGSPKGAATCDLLFVTRTPGKRAEDILNSVTNLPVLTVGERPGFAEQGGCINLIRTGQQVRFEINLEAARAAELKINSQLSGMATVVKTKRKSQ